MRKLQGANYAISKLMYGSCVCTDDKHSLKLVAYAPVICIYGPLRAGDTGDIAALKCRNLTSDVSRQCRGCPGG